MEKYFWALFALIAVLAYMFERKLENIIDLLEQIRDQSDSDDD
jgi:hypothetical protein